MNIPGYTIVPFKVRNINTILHECIISNNNCTNGLHLSNYATVSTEMIKKKSSLNQISSVYNELSTKIGTNITLQPKYDKRRRPPKGRPHGDQGVVYFISAILKKYLAMRDLGEPAEQLH